MNHCELYEEKSNGDFFLTGLRNQMSNHVWQVVLAVCLSPFRPSTWRQYQPTLPTHFRIDNLHHVTVPSINEHWSLLCVRSHVWVKDPWSCIVVLMYINWIKHKNRYCVIVYQCTETFYYIRGFSWFIWVGCLIFLQSCLLGYFVNKHKKHIRKSTVV